jgi:drug/metabolite transporter (DMT)-like permease
LTPCTGSGAANLPLELPQGCYASGLGCSARSARVSYRVLILQSKIKTRLAAIPDAALGVIYMALAAVAFTAMHALIRVVTTEIHPFEAAFFRVFFGLFVLAPVIMQVGFSSLKTKRWGLFGLRGILNAIAMLCFFVGMSQTELALATALGFTAPLFATVLAIFFLGEVVRIRRWTAIIIGFVGALIILRPGFVDLSFGPMLIVTSAAVWSVALMVIKVLTRTESSVTITTYASIYLSPVILIIAIPYWTWPSWEMYFWLFLMAALGTFAQTALNQALKLADASVVLPVDFTKLIWATLLGFAMFDEIPDVYTWGGGLLIFLSTTYIGVRESRLRRERTATSGSVDASEPKRDKPD